MRELSALQRLYHPELPDFLIPFLDTAEMNRIRHVGMNCGCEYTSFPLFAGLPAYSRAAHCLGAALIVWHFTRDRRQTLTALFHDIAAPVFAHTVDFLNGDYLLQESTEARTGGMIRGSIEIMRELRGLHIPPEAVEDDRLYPIANNDSPRLSADRLEYTMGNLTAFGFCTVDLLARWYGALTTVRAEDGQPELAFTDAGAAEAFGLNTLLCSSVYVADEDRYSMQRLSEVLREAIRTGCLSQDDLYRTEPEVISRLEQDAVLADLWRQFRNLHRLRLDDGVPEALRRVIPAKKRYIDPLVAGRGRLSAVSSAFRDARDRFLGRSQAYWLYAE